MKPGEQFELESLEYLRKNYGKSGIEFIHHNTSDSTGSDIEVIINGYSKFFIEVKDTEAQSGQFVLLADEKNKLFKFSHRNKSIPNEMTNIIISHINNYYDRFNSAGTAGEIINIKPEIFTKWIIGHYREKKVKYVISKRKNIIICPIDKFGDYFEVSATFRIKKSGSSEPAAKNVDAVINTLKIKLGINNISKKIVNGKKKLFVYVTDNITNNQFKIGDYTYFLSPQNDIGCFEVRRLSNTNNKNVIFKINVKQEQISSDLEQFKSELL